MSSQNNIFSISIDASTSHLAEVRNFVGEHSQKIGLSKDQIDEIRLAVDEAYTNIIKHAYKRENGKPVTIEFGYDDSQIWVTLTDRGESFDPSQYNEPDLQKRIKNKQRGGMGVFLIRKLMDSVHYSRSGKQNTIKMVKNL